MAERTIRTAAQCDCLAIRQAARQITQLYEGHLSKAGLTANQYAILRKLSGLGRLSIGDLAETMVMDSTTVTRAIKPLFRDGLLGVARAKDKRTRLVDVTARGRAKLRAADGHWRKAQDAFEQAFGAADAQALRQTMWRVVESIPAAE
ncbi:MAG: MarR family winged helix-turn-helix transcriptional regulator [Pseudolabrys sp.]